MLYQLETNNSKPELALENYCKVFPYQQDIIDYASSLIDGVKTNCEAIDNFIKKVPDTFHRYFSPCVSLAVLSIIG